MDSEIYVRMFINLNFKKANKAMKNGLDSLCIFHVIYI